jgi:VIT1/CCC1 family predicted Fe2+/Mn2+ transporter
LISIYEGRGLTRAVAEQVTDQLMAHDALGAHAREELGIVEIHRARPIQAALASATTFAVGAFLPLLAAMLAPRGAMLPIVAVSSLIFLAGLGGLSARTGGAPVGTATLRVTFWGALAMAITAGAGALFGAAG